MKYFPDELKKWAVQQKSSNGCTLAGYEMLLRAKKMQGIDFDNFQNDFSRFEGKTFEEVAVEIQKKYPQVSFTTKTFNTGTEKLQYIEDQLKQNKQILISVWMETLQQGNNNWHTMPILEWDGNNFTLLHSLDSNGQAKTIKATKQDLIRIQNTHSGGNDLAFAN